MQGVISFLTDLAIDSNKLDVYVKDPKTAYESAGLTKEEVELLETENSFEICKELLKSGNVDDVARFTTTKQTNSQISIKQIVQS